MANRFGVSVLALVTALALADSAEAQRRRGLVDVTSSGERHGFWINLGVGAGKDSYKFEGDPGWTDNPTKPSFSLRLGGTVNPNFRLGGEITGWVNDGQFDDQGDRITEYLTAAMLIGQFYPSQKAGLFFKGGAGFSRSGVSVYGPGDSHEDGFAWSAGAGYEIKLSRALFLTPTVDFLQHRSEANAVGGVASPALYERLFTIGVALTIQPSR
ncbi:MAG: porin family protein [Gemmatimonadetes bacterium]|nr:porin family protein [Gemmatimonadota bacterium]